MFKRITLGIHAYYLTIIIILVGVFSYGGYFYSQTGFLNSNYISSLYEANYIFAELLKTSTLDNIKTNIEKFNIRSAQKEYLTLSSNLKRIKLIKKFSEKDGLLLEQNEVKVREQFGKLISFPEIESLLNVILAKMNRFNEIVNNRNWVTLSRIASRVKIKLSQENFGNVNKLKDISDFVIKDVKQMKMVTENSVLRNEDKVFILNQLENMNTELLMLDNYVTELKKLNQDFEFFAKEYKDFIKKTSPNVSLEKIEFDNKVKYVLYFGLLIFTLGIFFIFISLILVPVFNKRINKKVSDNAIKLINEYLLPVNEPEDLEKLPVSAKFIEEFNKSRKYVQKRMNFGQIFQESLPFASVLLDTNLKVVWANSQFFEILNFDMKDTDKENLTWDYLARFTNLGDSDPILESFKNNMPGIFQLKIKPRLNDKAVPYELYANPSSINDKKRLMLVFYPLSYLEDTIENQSLTLLRPIEKTLNILNSNLTVTPELSEMKNEFVNAEIAKIYDLFMSVVTKINKEKGELIDEITTLEIKLKDQFKVIKDIEKFNDRNIELQTKTGSVLNNLKEKVLNLVESNEEQINLKVNWAEKNIDFITQYKSLVQDLEKEEQKLITVFNSFNSLIKHRGGIKEIKAEVDLQREKIIQLLDQTLIHQKSVNLEPALVEQSFNRIKQSVKSFDRTIAFLDKTLMQFDVSISKIEMELEGKRNINDEKRHIDTYKLVLHNYAQISKDTNDSILNISQNAHYQEDKIISYIKELYGQIKKSMEQLKSIQTLSFTVNEIFFEKTQLQSKLEDGKNKISNESQITM